MRRRGLPKTERTHFVEELVPKSVIGEIRDTDTIKPNPNQIRKTFEDIDGLAQSIREYGLIHPIVIQENGTIIAGERRWRACKRAGIDKVPVVVSSKPALELSLVENLQRQDLHPLEEAEGLAHLLHRGYTQEQLAQRIGKDRTIISKSIQLLKLPQKVKDECATLHNVSRDLLLQVVSQDTEEEQLRIWERIQSGGLSARQLKKKHSTVTIQSFVRRLRTFEKQASSLTPEKASDRDIGKLKGAIEEAIQSLTLLLSRLEHHREE